MRFYTGEMFPEEYRGAISVARRGSWNRTPNVGFDVVLATLSSDGKRAGLSPFLTGFFGHREQQLLGPPRECVGDARWRASGGGRAKWCDLSDQPWWLGNREGCARQF